MFSKILVAFDGNNLNVLRALAKVSRSPDIKIYLVSVVKLNFFGKFIRGALALFSKEWKPATFTAVESSAQTAAKDMAIYSDKVVTFLRLGDPYVELKKVIKEVQPDLIIVGGSLATAEMTMFSPPTVGMRIASIAKVSLLLAK